MYHMERSRSSRLFFRGFRVWFSRILLAWCTLGANRIARSADLVPDNIVVARIGSGTSLNSSAFAISIQEFTSSGILLQTLSNPFLGPNLLTDSGSATSNGYINTYGSFLAVPGSNLEAGTANASAQNAKATNILGLNAEIASRTIFPTGGPTGTPPSPFSGSNFRSVIPTSANTFYATGTSSGSPLTGGIWYKSETDFVQVSATQNNLRNVEIYGGQLYVTSGAANSLGISKVGSDLPATAGSTTTLVIPTGTGSSPYGFVLFDTDGNGSNDRAYIADERTSAGGGIQRWDLNSSGIWVNSYSRLFNTTNSSLTSSTGSGIVAIRGLTGRWDPFSGTAWLVATTTETSNNRLVSILDSGSIPTGFSTLAQAGTNYVFRGVDFSPIPEPSSYILAVIAAGVLALMKKKSGIMRQAIQ